MSNDGERGVSTPRLPGRRPEGQRSHWSLLGDVLLFVLLVGLLTLLYTPVALLPAYLPAVGDVAVRDVKADRDILIEDHESTRKRQEEAAAEVLPVYDWDGEMVIRLVNQLKDSLLWLERTRGDTPQQTPEQLQALREGFAQRLEREIPDKVFTALLGMKELEPLLEGLDPWLLPLAGLRVATGPEVLRDLSRSPYLVRSLADQSEMRAIGVEGMTDLAGLRRQLASNGARALKGLPRLVRNWLVNLASDEARPNLVLNLAETNLRRQAARDAVEPVYFKARRGEMIVREGAVVTDAARLKIEAMSRSNWTGVAVLRILGLAGVLLLFLWQGRRFLLTTSSSFPRDRKTLHILGAILLVVALFSAVIFAVGQGLAELFGWPETTIAYLAPVALGAALASLIVGARVALPGGALILGTMLSFLASLMANGGLHLFIYYLIGSLVGGYSLRTCRRRFDVLRAGAWVGLFQMVAVPLVEALAGHLPSWSWLLGSSMGLTSGLLAGILGLGLIPLMESVFNIVTDSRLLELASGDHPLLKELSLRAPGTYHHSVMMGNLAEAGAEAIGANPLLARVMALYHDIGKVVKPQYFVENQAGENRHDHLAPSMSAKVIMSHIKEGVELARQHKLGGPILEAITEHQGTTKLQFFYNKALSEANRKGEQVAEEEYRYPGPKPQTPESGILMIADSVEAAARSLKNPSPAQIQSLVRRIARAKIEDGQLDECKLTLRQLAKIEEAFVRVLTLGFYHRRIEYPEQIKRQREGVRHGGAGLGQPNPHNLARSA